MDTKWYVSLKDFLYPVAAPSSQLPSICSNQLWVSLLSHLVWKEQTVLFVKQSAIWHSRLRWLTNSYWYANQYMLTPLCRALSCKNGSLSHGLCFFARCFANAINHLIQEIISQHRKLTSSFLLYVLCIFCLWWNQRLLDTSTMYFIIIKTVTSPRSKSHTKVLLYIYLLRYIYIYIVFPGWHRMCDTRFRDKNLQFFKKGSSVK